MEVNKVWRDNNFTSNYFGVGKTILISRFIAYPSVMHYLGNIEEKSLLDIACGEGDFCRLVKTKKASRVVGVDISPVMIHNALEENKKIAGCDVEFYQGDARDLNTIGQFDYVTANYLLPWLDSVDDITKTCIGVYKNLKPGGRFVSTIVNTTVNPIWDKTLKKYGVYNCIKLPDNKNKLKIILQGNNDKVFEGIVNLFFPDECQQAFIKAGFTSFEIKETLVDKDVIRKNNSDGFWDTYISKPLLLCIVAKKL